MNFGWGRDINVKTLHIHIEELDPFGCNSSQPPKRKQKTLKDTPANVKSSDKKEKKDCKKHPFRTHYGKGVHPWHSKCVELAGNSMSLPDLASVLVPLVYNLPGIWECDEPYPHLESLKTTKKQIVFDFLGDDLREQLDGADVEQEARSDHITPRGSFGHAAAASQFCIDEADMDDPCDL